MRKHSIFMRVISMLLICFLMISLLPITALAAEDDTPAVEQEVNDPQTEKTDTASPNMNEPSSEMIETEEAADPDEIVRVSIILGKDSTLAAGYSAQNIAKNVSARSYRNALRAEQAATERKIERTTGEELMLSGI